MELIHHHLHDSDAALPKVALAVERAQLSKRRWRAVAADGAEFGFDLEHRLADGDVIFQSEGACYVIAQQAEPVLEIPLPADPRTAARLGWLIGNLHFPLQVTPEAIRVAEDPALRQLCEREGLSFIAVERVFQPLSGGHSHGPHEH